MKAMILAAGLGIRLKPYTNTKPKALLKVGNRTLLEYTILYLKKYEVKELVINVHHFPDQIITYLNENNGFGMSYRISDERDLLMNTGGAIVKASQYLKDSDPFILLGVDIMTNLDLNAMLRFHHQKKPLATLAVKKRNTSRSLLFDKHMQLTGWRDNDSGAIKGRLAVDFTYALGFSAIHVIDPGIFDCINESGPFPITDLYLRLMETHPIIGYRHDDSDWIEFGRTDRMEQLMASQEFKRLIDSF